MRHLLWRCIEAAAGAVYQFGVNLYPWGRRLARARVEAGYNLRDVEAVLTPHLSRASLARLEERVAVPIRRQDRAQGDPRPPALRRRPGRLRPGPRRRPAGDPFP